MCMGVLPACVYMCIIMCMLGVCGDQKKASDPLELELHRVGNCHVGAGNQTYIICRYSKTW